MNNPADFSEVIARLQAHAADLSHQLQAAQQESSRLRRQEQRYHSFIDEMEDGFYEVDLRGNIRFVNRAFCLFCGYENDEIIGQNYRTFVDPSQQEILSKIFNAVYQTGIPHTNVELQLIRKDGTPWYGELSINLVHDESREPTGFYGIVRDTTERRKMEDELRASQQFFQNLLDQPLLAITEWSPDFRVLEWNRAAVSIFGFTREEMLGHYGDVLVAPPVQPDVLAAFKQKWEQILTTKDFLFSTNENFTKDGQSVICNWYNLPRLDKHGNVVSIISLAIDVTEQYAIEQVLRESLQRLEILINQDQFIITESALDHTILHWNRAAEAIFGYSAKEMVGSSGTCLTLDNPMSQAQVDQAWQQVINTRQMQRSINQNLRKDGQVITCEWYNVPVLDREEKVVRIICIGNNVTDRVNAEAALRASENRHRALLDAIPDLLFRVNSEGLYLDCRIPPEHVNIVITPDQIIGKFDRDLLTPAVQLAQQQCIRDALETGAKQYYEYELDKRNYESRVVKLSEDEVVIIARDVTEQKQSEIALRESERRYRAIIETMQEGYYETTLAGHYVQVNQAFANIVGYSMDDLIGKRPFDIPLFDETNAQNLLEVFRQIFTTGQPAFGEGELITSSGEVRVVDGTGYLVTDEAGKPTGFRGILRDITERRKTAETLREAGAIVTSTLEQDKAVSLIMEQLYRMLPYDTASIQLLRDDYMEVIGMQGMIELGEFSMKGRRWPLADSRPNAEVVKQQQSFVINEIESCPYDELKNFAAPFGFHAWLGVPLIIQDQVMGMIGIDSKQKGYFNEERIRLAEAFANHVAIAIHNAQLFTEVQQTKNHLQSMVAERTAQLEEVRQITLQMTHSLELSQVLDLIISAILKLIPILNIHIWLYHEDNLVFGMSQSAEEQRGIAYAEPRPEGVTYQIARSRQPLIIPDMLKHSLFQGYIVGSIMPSMFVGLPLKIVERVVGVITLISAETLNEKDLNLLSMLADQAAIAIENSRLYSEIQEAKTTLEARVQERTAQLETIRQMSLRLTASLEPEAVFNVVIDAFMNLDGFLDNIHIFLYDGEKLQLGLAQIDGKKTRQPFSEPRPDGLTYTVARTGRPLVINDPGSHPIYQGYDPQGVVNRSMLSIPLFTGIPLKMGGRVVGVITAARRQPFSEEDLRLLSALADQAAIAIENARLYRELSQTSFNLEALRQLSLELTSSLEIEHVLSAVMNAFVILGSISNSIYIFLYQNDKLKFGIGQLNREHVKEPLSEPRSNGLTYTVAQSGKPLVINDAYTHPLYQNYKFPPGYDYFAIVGIPLKIGERVVGVINATRSEPYTENDLRPLYALSDQAAIAIENARLYRELEEAQSELERLVEETQQANRAKSTFLANMSHELRTPLNAILGFAQIMERDQTLSPSQREHVEVISQSGSHLLGLINSVLEMSKIEAGRTSLELTVFNVKEVLHTIEGMLRYRANAKDLTFRFEIEANIPGYIRSDEGKLRQILINLLGNAIKFTEAGGVTLSVKLLQVEPISWLVFEIEDTGVGIAPEEIPALFQPFSQTDSGRSKLEGTGLGLVISREFVELMRGTISVKSTPGQGTVFTFQIPLETTDALPETNQPARRVVRLHPDHGPSRILIVDDNLPNRRLLVELLHSVGFEVKEAVNGVEAVRLWESWQPHLIWMDMRMPVMDGYEATRIIKARSATTIIIGLTASALQQEQAAVLAAGCDDFVRKPIQEDVLFGKIKEHLRLDYIYEEPRPAQILEKSRKPLLREAFKSVPPEWKQEFKQMLLMGEPEKMKLLIANIAHQLPELAEYLRQLIDTYQFDKIHAMLTSTGELYE